LKPAVELLAKAGVINLVANTGANGIPLASEADPSYFKAILLDVALMQNLLGSNDGMWIVDPASTIINKGAVAKAFVGQELLAYSSSTTRHNLYFWARDKRGASAEVDYVVETGGAIMPVEVKSGSSAHARSIRVFMKEKNSPAGVCFTPHPPRLDGRIKHVPVYAVEYLPVLKAAGTRLLK
jgi:predicted AAA+ superfamily ATPase